MFSMIAILYIPSKFMVFFLPGPATGHSRVASVQRNLATPTSISPAPLVSSPSPDANGGIDLLVIESSDCSALHLSRTNQCGRGN